MNLSSEVKADATIPLCSSQALQRRAAPVRASNTRLRRWGRPRAVRLAALLVLAGLGPATAVRAQDQRTAVQSDCVQRYGYTGCAAYHYAQVLCEIVGTAADLSRVQARLHQRFEAERIDFQGIAAERVESTAVRYYVPQLCPAKKRLIWGVFLPSEAG